MEDSRSEEHGAIPAKAAARDALQSVTGNSRADRLRVSSRDKQHHDFWCQRGESQIVHRWFNHRDVGGHVEAGSGNGSIIFKSAPDSAPSFQLETGIGSITVHLDASATGSIEAGTSIGNVTINGNRQPQSVIGERNLKKIVLKENGPASKIHCGNGSITISLD